MRNALGIFFMLLAATACLSIAVAKGVRVTQDPKGPYDPIIIYCDPPEQTIPIRAQSRVKQKLDITMSKLPGNKRIRLRLFEVVVNSAGLPRFEEVRFKKYKSAESEDYTLDEPVADLKMSIEIEFEAPAEGTRITMLVSARGLPVKNNRESGYATFFLNR